MQILKSEIWFTRGCLRLMFQPGVCPSTSRCWRGYQDDVVRIVPQSRDLLSLDLITHFYFPLLHTQCYKFHKLFTWTNELKYPNMKIKWQHKLQLDTQYISTDGTLYIMNQMVLVRIDPRVSHMGGDATDAAELPTQQLTLALWLWHIWRIYHTLHYITLHYRHFKCHLHLKWPVVHQQLHVMRNTAHRPSMQASYTASRIRPKRKISCAAAQIAATQIAATLTISFPGWRHMSLTLYWVSCLLNNLGLK